MCADGAATDTAGGEPVAEVEATAIVEADDVVVATDADEMQLEAQEGAGHAQGEADVPDEEFFGFLAGSVDNFPYCANCFVRVSAVDGVEGRDFWRIRSTLFLLPPIGFPGDFVDHPRTNFHFMCSRCVYSFFYPEPYLRVWGGTQWYDSWDCNRPR